MRCNVDSIRACGEGVAIECCKRHVGYKTQASVSGKEEERMQ